MIFLFVIFFFSLPTCPIGLLHCFIISYYWAFWSFKFIWNITICFHYLSFSLVNSPFIFLLFVFPSSPTTLTCPPLPPCSSGLSLCVLYCLFPDDYLSLVGVRYSERTKWEEIGNELGKPIATVRFVLLELLSRSHLPFTLEAHLI